MPPLQPLTGAEDTARSRAADLRACCAAQLVAIGAVRGDYLYRFRSVALPLLGPEWELRYFSLVGTTIR